MLVDVTVHHKIRVNRNESTNFLVFSSEKNRREGLCDHRILTNSSLLGFPAFSILNNILNLNNDLQIKIGSEVYPENSRSATGSNHKVGTRYAFLLWPVSSSLNRASAIEDGQMLCERISAQITVRLL